MSARNLPEIYLTASEAFPALEAEFLAAETEIIAAFRIFDASTTLRSDAAKKIGDTWADLIAHVIAKNVRITLRISDFDPVVGTNIHRKTHASVAKFRAAVGDNPLLDVQPAQHPAKIGILPRLLLWPKTYMELRGRVDWLAKMTPEDRTEALANMPALAPYLRVKGDTVQAKLFPPATLRPVTHHQKLAVFDRKRLYIGGLDLDDRRYDTLDHDRAGAQTWHDVQVLVDGKPATAAYEYLTAFAASDYAALRKPNDGILRTYSVARKFSAPFLSPQPVLNGIETAHLNAIKTARQLIYLESQFFRDRTITDALCAAGRANPDLSVILILPAAPEDVAYEKSTGSDARYGEYLQAKCIDQLRKTFKARAFIGAPAQPRRTNDKSRATLTNAPLVYVHAKVSVFDDDLAIVSSANLNGRSMKWDTEAGVQFDDPATVSKLKQRCFDHWLRDQNAPHFSDPAKAVTAWHDLAEANHAKSPETRKTFILPYPVAPARKFGRNLPGVPEEMV